MTIAERIRSEIEALIMSGTWDPGFRIPYERELMETYRCSRMTVNKALSGLVACGLLERRKRAGTFVSIPRSHRSALQVPDISNEILSRNLEYSLKLLSRIERAPNGSDRDRLSMKQGTVLQIDCVHFADGKPFALEQRLINLNAVPDASIVNFAELPPGAWLLTHVPWTNAEHRIRAINADEEVADGLEIPPNQACLLIERWTWRTAERITYVKQIYPGDQYDLTAHFLS